MTGVLAVALMTLAAAGTADAHKKHRHKPAADTVFLGGKVLGYRLPGGDVTQMERVDARWSEALAVKRGKIVFVGDNKGAARLVGHKTKVIHLKGKLVMPGLLDGHFHGARASACDLEYMKATDVDAVLARIKACLLRDNQRPYLTNPDSLLTVTSFSTLDDVDNLKFTRQVIDRLSADPAADPQGAGTKRPIRVVHSQGHVAYANSRALEVAGINENTPDPSGGGIARDAAGVPTGILTDVSAFFGTPPPLDPQASYRAKVTTVDALNREGVTGGLQAAGSARDLELWKQVADSGELTMNVSQALTGSAVRGKDRGAVKTLIDGYNAVRSQYDGYSSAASPGEISVDTIKIFCDGVPDFPGQTAAMLKPYLINVGTPENPEWVPGTRRGEDPSCADGRLGFTMLHQNNWKIATHAMGDRAVRDALDNFEVAEKADPRRRLRNSIHHTEYVAPADRARFGKLGVIANIQFQWAQRNPYFEETMRDFVGPERYFSQYPVRTIMKSRGVVAGGSDWPVDPLDSWLQIQTAITRQSPNPADREEYPGELGEPMTRVQAAFAHTLATAYMLNADKRTGSIQVGKDADLIITDRNMFRVPKFDIAKTSVLLTMFRGSVVWEDPEF